MASLRKVKKIPDDFFRPFSFSHLGSKCLLAFNGPGGSFNFVFCYNLIVVLLSESTFNLVLSQYTLY